MCLLCYLVRLFMFVDPQPCVCAWVCVIFTFLARPFLCSNKPAALALLHMFHPNPPPCCQTLGLAVQVQECKSVNAKDLTRCFHKTGQNPSIDHINTLTHQHIRQHTNTSAHQHQHTNTPANQHTKHTNTKHKDTKHTKHQAHQAHQHTKTPTHQNKPTPTHQHQHTNTNTNTKLNANTNPVN